VTPPSSTYRLQLRPEFTFGDAADVVDYLHRLGIGAMYASPMLDAAPGSTHGYDVVDPTRARPDLGGETGRQALVARLREVGLGLVVDIVPNHLSTAPANKWWWDVLQHGQASRYAKYFDIDWSRERLLLPVLGSPEDIEKLTIEGDELVYYGQRFPIDSADGTPQEVHDRQHYELVDWRRGNAELNYRRFFDITTLAGVRVEDNEVFDATHNEVLRWVTEGDVMGLRVDHPDGLSDPGGYLRRLRAAAPNAWLVVEKILHPGEELPASWPVHGTTGYDALREISGVFIDPDGERKPTELPSDFRAVQDDASRLVTNTILVAEIRRIAALVEGVEPDTARAAIAELLRAFDVYRSYLPEHGAQWAAALTRAEQTRPDLGLVLAAINQWVRADPHGELATRIQQTSGMIMAKGTEDTAFYRYTRFVALNEVGGTPDRFGVDVSEFHRAATAREAGWPATMTALSTHDTKRSEDVRARLAVLAELPGEFADAVKRWSAHHAIDEPALNLLAWQTLVGAWPISAARLADYLLKAAREAKIRTTWIRKDDGFEQTVQTWPDRVLADSELWADIHRFVDRIKQPGWSNALGQKLLQLVGPGVPDVYQGTELWDLSLVDPDNRRAVDFTLRRELLERVVAGRSLPDIDDTGAAKLLVVHRALILRRDRPELFHGYRPLSAEGPATRHAIAFARSADLVAVATRLPVRLAADGWRDTVLPLPGGGDWTDVLTGREVDAMPPLDGLLDRYPVALLVRR
jgi:(1->4)-alpha-D-glucan 1-alpha-D-glucosylmutase